MVEIELFGQPYVFKADTESLDAQEVADFFAQEVDRVVHEFRQDRAHISQKIVLISAALNIASKYMELKSKYADSTERMHRRATDLKNIVDAYLATIEQ